MLLPGRLRVSPSEPELSRASPTEPQKAVLNELVGPNQILGEVDLDRVEV